VAQQRAIDETTGLLRQCQVHADDIRLLHQVLGRGHDLDVETFRGGVAGRRILVEAAAPDEHRHPERAGEPRHLLADVPEPQQAKGLSHQAFCARVFLLIPLARAEIGHVVGDAPIDRQDQRHRQLRHRDRVFPRAVRHINATLGGARNVDGIDAGAGAHDQRQRARIEHGGGDGGRAHNEDRRL
jgi:hypothetical protein